MEQTIKTEQIQLKNAPEMKFTAGAVTATIWKNESSKGAYRTVQLNRNYKDKDDKWQSTNSLRLNDLPKAAVVLNKAYEFLVLRDPGNFLGGSL